MPENNTIKFERYGLANYTVLKTLLKQKNLCDSDLKEFNQINTLFLSNLQSALTIKKLPIYTFHPRGFFYNDTEMDKELITIINRLDVNVPGVKNTPFNQKTLSKFNNKFVLTSLLIYSNLTLSNSHPKHLCYMYKNSTRIWDKLSFHPHSNTLICDDSTDKSKETFKSILRLSSDLIEHDILFKHVSTLPKLLSSIHNLNKNTIQEVLTKQPWYNNLTKHKYRNTILLAEPVDL